MKYLFFVLVQFFALCHAATGLVVGVSDGDTITVLTASKEKIRIRLAEIDAPESKQDFGARSKQSLADICFGKNAVFSDAKKDRYGRVVSLVKCDGVDAQAHQIDDGMAWVYEDYATPAGSYLRKKMALAKAARKGLWSDSNPVPPWQFRREKK